MKARKQCKNCPWKTSTGRNIPNGFRPDADALMRRMTGSFDGFGGSGERQQCYETPDTDPLICVGYAMHALGPGNDLALRIDAMRNPDKYQFELDGPQHDHWRDVVPR